MLWQVGVVNSVVGRGTSSDVGRGTSSDVGLVVYRREEGEETMNIMYIGYTRDHLPK